MQEAEIEQARLKMEQAIIEENFRVREEELMEEESDGRSVSSEQSSISKVQQWQKEQPYSARTSTMTEAAPTTGGLVHTQVALTIGSEGNIVDEELEGTSLNPCYVEPVLGGIIDRAASMLGTIPEVDSLARNSNPGPSRGTALPLTLSKQSDTNILQNSNSVSFQPPCRSSLANANLAAIRSNASQRDGRNAACVSSGEVHLSDDRVSQVSECEVRPQRQISANPGAPLPRPRRMGPEASFPRQRSSIVDPPRFQPQSSVLWAPQASAIVEQQRMPNHPSPIDNQSFQSWGPTPDRKSVV